MDTKPDTKPDTGSDTGPYTADAPTRAAVAYAQIKRGLLAGAYPISARMAEERLAREFGVSRTPVREALSRLDAEGLMERHPDGGYAPAVPDLDEIVELYEVRAVLEQAALARPVHDTGLLVELRADWQAMADDLGAIAADPEFVLLDEDFHQRLAATGGNHALVATLAGVNERIRIVRMHDFLTIERIEATIEQHLGIVDALLGDQSAAAALADHLDESAAVVQQRAAAAIARMLTSRRDT